MITDNFIEAEVIEFDELKVNRSNTKERTYSVRYTCLDCEHEETVRYKRKSDFREIDLCPECNGLIVDLWRYPKYKHLKRNR